MILNSGLARRQRRAGYSNPILDYARDDYYPGCDIYGLAVGWQFALADHLTDYSAVPAEWGFRQAMAGADTETPEYVAIADATRSYSDTEALEFMLHAGRVFAHLVAQSRLAGRDY